MDRRQRLAKSSARILRGCYFLWQNIEYARALIYNWRQFCIGLIGKRPTAGYGGICWEELVG
jgi:hypothetical protein